jgi:hypothetical protein
MYITFFRVKMSYFQYDLFQENPGAERLLSLVEDSIWQQ